MLLGDMQDWKPNVASIIEYAADIYPETEVVSKLVSGEVHRTNSVSYTHLTLPTTR